MAQNLQKSNEAWARLRARAAQREHPNRTAARRPKNERVNFSQMMRENRMAGV